MDLSIIIVSWKVKEKLRENLNALYASHGNFSFEVIVIDNNSGDGSVEMVRTEFPSVIIIANAENVGFAKANNQGLKIAQGEYLLLLNPDMLLESGTLANSLAWVKNNQQATVSACLLLDQEKRIIKHVRRFPKLFDQLMIILKVPHLFPDVINNYLDVDFLYSKAAKVDSVRGAYFLINKKAWQKISGAELPLLDERYFIWFEEVDFCRQVYKLGGEVWYFPDASCLDYVGASFQQVNISAKQGYFEKSMLSYFKKWHPLWQFFILKITWPLGKILAKIFSN